ncbi:MAG: hypothetical protein WC796_06285 [Candidatus Pacearchaeota archaeon]|jgi:hypothetical protein
MDSGIEGKVLEEGFDFFKVLTAAVGYNYQFGELLPLGNKGVLNLQGSPPAIIVSELSENNVVYYSLLQNPVYVDSQQPIRLSNHPISP